MELKTLWLGILVSVAAFAIKTGIGWSYMLTGRTAGRKILSSTLLLSVYAAIFAAVYLLIRGTNVVANYEILIPLWQNGVALHWVLALLLFIWGLLLYRSDASCHHAESAGKRVGWLALVVPCPVCLGLIVFSTAAMALYFPEESALAVAMLYAAFVAIATVSSVLAAAMRKFSGENAENALGLTMMMIGSYFIVSALVMPSFAEISKVYRLMVYSAETRQGDLTGLLTTVAGILAVALCGFAYTHLGILRRGKVARNAPDEGRYPA